jgi:hypothetical protein
VPNGRTKEAEAKIVEKKEKFLKKQVVACRG